MKCVLCLFEMESSKKKVLFKCGDKSGMEMVVVGKKKKEVEKVQVEKKDEEVKKEGEEGEEETKPELEEKKDKEFEKDDSDWDSETDYVFNGENDYDDEEEEEEEDKENECNHTAEYAALVNWRVDFRNRHRVMSDNIAVDPTSSAYESAEAMMRELSKGPDGETIARNFQFRHELKDSSYKNKYILRLDAHKMTFSERDDSVIVRTAEEASVRNETSEYRNRNMAMEELYKMLSLKIRVWRSLFVSNSAQQMGEMELSKCVNTITAENLTVQMDSYPNVVQAIKLHQPVLEKFTLLCHEDFSGIIELEQVRNCPRLKLDGLSNFTDEHILSIKANVFECKSKKVTSEGINAFLKTRLSEDLPDDFHTRIISVNGTWNEKEVLKGFEYTKYESEAAYVRINGSIPFNVSGPLLCSMATNKSDERLVVLLTHSYFQCFKEGQLVEYLCHDNVYLD